MSQGMTHDDLCARAVRWLRGTMHCNPVFSRNASCGEVPDAIGWTSRYSSHGSIVVECKTSHSDFLADKKKAVHYKHPEHNYSWYSGRRMARKVAQREGYIEVAVPRMGDFRYFMCVSPTFGTRWVGDAIITAEDIQKHAPDHGLLYVEGRRIRVIVPAPRREKPDYPSEIRYLRFAIINGKNPHELVRADTKVAQATEQTNHVQEP